MASDFRRFRRGVMIVSVMAGLLSASVAQAGPVIWTDWTSGSPGGATGTLSIDGTPVTVSYSGEFIFLQTNGGPNYWNPTAPYTSPTVPNAPTGTDIIAITQPMTRTITFSRPITNPLFAVVSLNANSYQFDHDFQILSSGYGYFGYGVLIKQPLSGGYFELRGISGEPHGVIEFQGTFSSITWRSTAYEYWNGFTIGVRGLAPEPEPEPVLAPEPAGILMLGSGFAALLGCGWLRRGVRRVKRRDDLKEV